MSQLFEMMLKRIELAIDKVKILEQIKELNKFDGLICTNNELNRLKFKLEIMEKIDKRLNQCISQYY